MRSCTTLAVAADAQPALGNGTVTRVHAVVDTGPVTLEKTHPTVEAPAMVDGNPPPVGVLDAPLAVPEKVGGGPT